jgi:hypothetical protein
MRLVVAIVIVGALVAMSGRAECAEDLVHRVVVMTGPEATLGFGRFCEYGTDTVGCGEAQGGLGWRLEAVGAIRANYEIGLGGALVRLPSQPANLWRAVAVGTWRFNESAVDTGFLTGTFGVAGGSLTFGYAL